LVLALTLTLVTAATTWTYFSYPLEVECMEGTNWIEALAIREGRSPYRDSGLAFINMNHGPLDAPAKAIVSRVLPWLESWQVIRLPGLLLPLALVLALRRGREDSSTLPWRWTTAVGLSAYFFILSSGNMVANMGRSDALMLLLLAPLIPLGAGVFTTDQRVHPWRALAGGALAAAAFLQNFRTALVLPSIALALAYDWRAEIWRPLPALARCLALAIAGFTAVFAFVLGAVFHFELATYFRYSIGFFLAPQGHGVSGLPRLRDLFGPFVENQGWLLLPAGLLLSIVLRPRSSATWIRATVLGAPFLLFLGAYAANHLGAAGGLHYFAPVVLLALLLWRLADWNEPQHAVALFAVLAASLLACNWRVVINNTSLLWHTRREAAEFDRFVRGLDARFQVESQDIHLFETRLRPTEVDMGFFSYLTHEHASADYFAAFAQRFAAHEARMKLTPPDVVVVGDFPSAELAERLRAGHYVIVRESPPRIYNAENLTRTRVFVSPKLAALFEPLANPQPQLRAW
jgi:hypothetical protein